MDVTLPVSRTDSARSERLSFLNREATEVYLLLDFLSGRADRSLRPTQEELAQSQLDRQKPPDGAESEGEQQRQAIERDLNDPTRLVQRTMRIRYPIEQGADTFQDDATFLMRARDVLNTRARPASGLTIAFTSMVAASAHARGDGSANFAEFAYPEFRDAASWQARWITGMLYVLPMLLVLALAVSAYAAWGKVMLDTLDAVRHDGSAIQQQLSTEHSSLLAASEAGALCDTSQHPRPAICAAIHDFGTRYAVASYLIATWEAPISSAWVTVEQEKDSMHQKQAEDWATALMTVLSNYLMPVLYGVLGSIAFVLRRHHDRLAAHLLSPRDLRANSIRLVLGILIGGCIGLIYSASATAQATGVLGAAATLSTAAIAFLAGYGVEGVFRVLDALIAHVFRVNGADTAKSAG